MDPLPLGRCSEKNFVGNPSQCHRWAQLVCLHCNQGVCFEHHQSHQKELQTRVHRLDNRINSVRQVLHTLTYEQMIENFHEKLDQWSDKCKHEIDSKHAKMSSELSSVMKQLNFDQFRSIQLTSLDRSIGPLLTDLLRMSDHLQIEHVKALEERLDQIEQTVEKTKASVQITEDGQLKINQPTGQPISLQKHFLTDCPGAMAGASLDSNYLLVFQVKPSFSLVLIDNNSRIIRTPIEDFVYDICWSQSIQAFLLATEHFLYEYYPLNNHLSRPYGNMKSSRMLWSLACDLTDLYIIYQPEMDMCQRDLKKPFEKKGEWKKNDLMCNKGDQTIGSIRIDEQRHILALSIKQNDHRWRVDLFSINNLQRLHCGSSFACSTNYCRMSPLLNDHNQWLVQCSQRILLDEDGQVINEMDRPGDNVTLMGRDQIAFLDSFGIDIYQRDSVYQIFPFY